MGKLLSIFTTATATGVSLRYLTTIVGSVLTIFGILGWLSPDQVEALRVAVPEFTAAIGALVAAGIPIYAAITKSSSDKAAAAAKQIDAKVPKNSQVVIKSPGSRSDIVVQPDGK
ncbi:hypothetical protein [Synechococcus phage Ssp-JY39]|nr:hypothetical protein [Synechococcus phage Yong-M2-251]